MFVAALEDGTYKQQKKTFWDDVYAVDMSCLAPTVMREPLVDVVSGSAVVSQSCKILDLDLCTMAPGDVEFVCGYQVKITQNEKVHGLIGWWDAHFSNLKNKQILTTSPFARSTHWKQTVFYSSQNMVVTKNDTLHGSIACR